MTSSPDVRLSRRHFLTACAAATASLASARRSHAKDAADPWLQMSVKAGMIQLPGDASWIDRLSAAKNAGFAGVEPQTGNDLDVDAIRAAATDVGITIDGTVGGYHWKIRHTDPDATVRAEAAKRLDRSLRQTAELGAETFLIVPGHGKDGDAATVRQRASDAIRNALPLAEQLGVSILIENVWNEMFYDPRGDVNQSADDLAAFVDSFDSDRVGVQFDLGNHWKFGDVAEWATTLGDRIKKLDIKGFSRAESKFTDVGEGDVDWAKARRALANIPFTGWVAAEVKGGDEARLRTIADQIDTALRCSRPVEDIAAG